MPRYLEVTTAAHETATKMLTQRGHAGYAVTVTTQGGRTASVSWDHVSRVVALNLPSLPADALLNRLEADRIVGFVAHEVCHVLHTDRAVWAEAVAAGADVQRWTNCLEDLRIETTEIAAGHYAALRSVLGNTLDGVHARAIEDRATTGRPAPGQAPGDAAYSAVVLGRVRNGYPCPSAAGLEASLSPEVRALVREALAGMRKCKNTRQVLALARRMAGLEQQQRQQDEQQQQPGQDPGQDGQQPGQDGQDGQDGQQPGQDGQQPGQQPGQDGQQPGQQPDQQPGQDGQQPGQDGQQPGQDGQDGQQPGQQPGHGINQPSLNAPDLGAALEALAVTVAARNDKPIDESGAYPSLHGWSVKVDDYQSEGLGNTYDAGARAALAERVPHKALLREEITRLLVSDEQRRVTHRETAGRLDRRALARMSGGGVDVFSRRHVRPGVATALLVLWDWSSSMRARTSAQAPSRMEISAGLVWQLAECANDAGATFGAYGFKAPAVPGPIPKGHLVPVWPLGDARPRDMASTVFRSTARGGTALAPVILEGARMLADTPATRRVMLVVTDGQCHYGSERVREACTLATDAGVEVVGLGIMAAREITEAFPDGRSINVNDAAELGRRGMRQVADLLDDGAGR